jgi:hypothetical protein
MLDATASFHTQRHRKRRLVGVRAGITAVAHVDVDVVDAGMGEANQNLAGIGTRDRYIDQRQTLGTAEVFDLNGLHRAPSRVFDLSTFVPWGSSRLSVR